MINRSNWGAWLYGALCVPIFWAIYHDLGWCPPAWIFSLIAFPLGGVFVFFAQRKIHADFEDFREAREAYRRYIEEGR